MDKKEVTELASDGGVQASLLLTVGPVVWKFVSNVSNVDFLLGLNGEKFNMFLNFLEGPGWAALMVAGIMWFIARVAYRKYIPIKAGPNWGLLASSAVVSFLFGILVAVNSTGGVPTLIMGWGSSDPHICISQVNMVKLVGFAKDYKLAVVCGLGDASQDKLELETITVSNRFTITSGVQPVVTSVSPAMATKEADLFKAAQQATGNPNAPVNLPIWYDVILLPNEVPASKITKLNDVLVLGGKILNPQYFH
jgi:hypothetical protein